jgi:hypothetical protein
MKAVLAELVVGTFVQTVAIIFVKVGRIHVIVLLIVTH